jgi:tRNA (guanine-N7-)-methyltransferase
MTSHDTTNNSPPLRTVKSFVLRTGRMTEGQKQAMAGQWPRYGLELADGMIDPVAVFGRRAPLVLEIGFGMGGSLAQMALEHPDRDYIGVEVHTPGIGNLLKLAEAECLPNLRVYRGDAKDVLHACIPDAALACVQIFFPDPWHKKRHHKRRLIQPEFVQELRAKLAPGGVLHLATDWEHYAQQMMEVLGAAPGWRNRFGAGAWASEHDRPSTKFEQRGERLGHGVWDLMFEKTA